MIAYAIAHGVPATSGRTELELSGGRLVATTWGEGGQELIRTTARVEIGTPFTGNGQLRYITRVGGELVSGRYPFVMQGAETFAVESVEFLDASHPVYALRPADPLTDHVRLLLARDLVLLSRRRGPARQRGRQLMGVWREQHPAVWETVVTPCDCCGQVVAKRLWIVEIDGREQRFCSPECEELFREYVLPRRAGRPGVIRDTRAYVKGRALMAGWILPALGYVVLVGIAGITTKVALRTIDWQQVVYWVPVAYVILSAILCSSSTSRWCWEPEAAGRS